MQRVRAIGQDDSLVGAIAACKAALAPSREIDARIALAVFPALRGLTSVAPGVWEQHDGGHVRALLYTAACPAAATLVPPGYWIETGPQAVVVLGELGEWIGVHSVEAIALCIAALDARRAELSYAQ
ncbi:hypothetical protein [Novosphingobium sp. G106]|uniref:hypothetical protein n=1 Tax=Novosphingobium sp. G106 TaxID=2849500 RepID=UPI0020C3BF42|nr:hypothetical protein [Novosphingobium sp. G106]